MDSLVSGAEIKLYETDLDREYDLHYLTKGTTDSTGKFQFNFLKNGYYYAKATHLKLGDALGDVSTPKNTVSFLEISFR